MVITTGTFLRGLVHIGMTSHPAGRVGEKTVEPTLRIVSGLRLRSSAFENRHAAAFIAATHIDFSKCTIQDGDADPKPFSFQTESVDQRPKVPCHLTYTNAKTAEIIKNNMHLSPLYSGRIEGVGPRYCPSIEDKVVKFPDRSTHHIFLEPEGLDTDWIYPNGISTTPGGGGTDSGGALDSRTGRRRNRPPRLRSGVRLHPAGRN